MEDEKICALAAQGRSVREIAALTGLNRGKVHRALIARRRAAVAVAAPDDPDDDPVMVSQAGAFASAGMSDAELAYMGWTREYVAGGLNALELYRLQALGSYREAGVALPERVVTSEPMPKHVRDALIVKLRRQGKTLSEIGAALVPKMSKGGVSRALARLEDEGGYAADDDDDW